MRSFMSATVAIVVPSFMVLLMITELPTLTGTSSIRPSMVERMSVVLYVLFDDDTPSRTICNASFAVFISSCALSMANFAFSYSSALTSLSSYNFLVRS